MFFGLGAVARLAAVSYVQAAVTELSCFAGRCGAARLEVVSFICIYIYIYYVACMYVYVYMAICVYV